MGYLVLFILPFLFVWWLGKSIGNALFGEGKPGETTLWDILMAGSCILFILYSFYGFLFSLFHIFFG